MILENTPDGKFEKLLEDTFLQAKLTLTKCRKALSRFQKYIFKQYANLTYLHVPIILFCYRGLKKRLFSQRHLFTADNLKRSRYYL